ncbi:MAG: hypothetical protein ACRCU5_15730 [Rhizobiaceae bacterium]
MTQSTFETVDFLTFYVTLAQQPGWFEHTRWRVNQMATEHPDLWADLPAQVKAELLRLKGRLWLMEMQGKSTAVVKP